MSKTEVRAVNECVCELNAKVDDAYALLNAIELMHANIVIRPTFNDNDLSALARDIQQIHALAFMAKKVLGEAVDIGNDADSLTAGINVSSRTNKPPLLNADETTFLENFKKLSDADKTIVSQLALRYRNTSENISPIR